MLVPKPPATYAADRAHGNGAAEISSTSSRRFTNTTRRPARSPSRSRSWWRRTSRPTSANLWRQVGSIATSGPRCGIYTLIMVDRKQKMPANFDLNDLKVGAVHLDWQTDEAKPAAELLPSLDDLPMELPSRPAGKCPFAGFIRRSSDCRCRWTSRRWPSGSTTSAPRGAGGQGFDESRGAVEQVAHRK